MRTIKCRAWDDFKKEMIHEFSAYDCHADQGELRISNQDNFGDYYELKLMQFTGLTDKNGVEIYEGDICRTHYWEPREDGSTILSDKYKKYKNVIIEYKPKYLFCGYTIHDWYEIIGNIHEHKHLLDDFVITD